MDALGTAVRALVVLGVAAGGVLFGPSALAAPADQLLPTSVPVPTFSLQAPVAPAPEAVPAPEAAVVRDAPDAWPAVAGGLAVLGGGAALLLRHRAVVAVAGAGAPVVSAVPPPPTPPTSGSDGELLSAVQRAARGLPYERPARVDR